MTFKTFQQMQSERLSGFELAAARRWIKWSALCYEKGYARFDTPQSRIMRSETERGIANAQRLPSSLVPEIWVPGFGTTWRLQELLELLDYRDDWFTFGKCWLLIAEADLAILSLFSEFKLRRLC